MIPTTALVRPVSDFRSEPARRTREFYGPDEIREIEDRLICLLEAERRPRWLIAQIFHTNERQIYRRLDAIKRRQADQEELLSLA